MRVLLAVLVALALAAIGFWLVGDGELDPEPGAEPTAPSPSQPVPEPVSESTPRAEAGSLAPQRLPEDLAPAPTAWLRVVDAATEQAIEGAAVYRVRDVDEAALAYTDARGLAALPLAKATQMMVARTGYLLRLAPTRTGSTEEQPQLVRLHADHYNVRGSFVFVGPAGEEPAEVCVRIRPLRKIRTDAPMPESLRAAGEDVQRAWREQAALAVARALPELHVQLGLHNALAVHLLRGRDEVAFVETGPFELEAATGDGLAARVNFDTDDFAKGPLRVELQRGASVHGFVRDEGGRPVADAYVSVDGGDPLRLQTRSGPDGGFAIGPLAPGPRMLDVRHRDHEPMRHGNVEAGGPAVEVRVKALPPTALRGRIVAAGTGKPIPGASASLLVPNGEPILVETDREGWFAARTSGTAAMRINAGAEGYLTHSELATPGEPPLAIELWPGTQERRLELRLSAVLAGIVVDASGAPVPGVALRWEPDAPALGFAGRRVLGGGALSLPQAVTAGPDGRFALEVAAFGAGALRVLDGAEDGGTRHRVTATAGKADTDLRVVAKKRGS